MTKIRKICLTYIIFCTAELCYKVLKNKKSLSNLFSVLHSKELKAQNY